MTNGPLSAAHRGRQLLVGYHVDIAVGDLGAAHTQAIGDQRGDDQSGDSRNDADRNDGGQRHVEALSRRDGVGVRAHDVAGAYCTELRHQHAHFMIACALCHLERDRRDGDARDVTENADGGQNPRCKRDRNQATLCAQPVHNRLGDAFSRTAFDQRTGEDTGHDDADDSRYDALRTGNDIVDRAGETGTTNKAADDRAEQHGVGRLNLFQNKYDSHSERDQCAQNGNSNSIHSEILLSVCLQMVELHDAALGAGGRELAVQAEPALLKLGLRTLPLLEARLDLLVRHEQIELLVVDVDLDGVAVVDAGDRAALCRLRGDMADEATVVRAGETAVRDERGGLGEAAAVQVLHGLEHLAHAGAALRALVADDDDMAVMNFAGKDGLLCGLLGVEADGLALEVMQALVERARLGGAGVGREVAAQNGDAAGVAERVVQRVVDQTGGRVKILMVLDILRERMRGDGHDVGLEHRLQIFHQTRHAAVLVEVHDAVLAGRVHTRELRRGVGQAVELVEHLDADLGLIGDGGQMHNGVGRAAHRQTCLDGVADGAVRDDLARGDVLFDQLHDLDAGLLCLHHADRGGRRGGAAVRQGHAERFRQRAHGVRGAEIRAGAAARAGGVLERNIFLLGDLACGEHAVGLGARGLVSLATVELDAALHRAARQEDARNVQTSRRHQHARNDLVARAEQNQTVKQIDLRHGLNGIGDQLARGHDEVHTVVALTHTVTAADHAKLNGRAACAVNAVLDALRDLTQIIVAGNALAPCVCDTDEGALQILRRKAHGFVCRTIILITQTLQNMFTAKH